LNSSGVPSSTTSPAGSSRSFPAIPASSAVCRCLQVRLLSKNLPALECSPSGASGCRAIAMEAIKLHLHHSSTTSCVYIIGDDPGKNLEVSTSLPFRPLTLPSHPSIPLPSCPHSLEVGPLNQARGSGERSKLPQRGRGRAPADIEFGAILALKSDIWWQQFY